MHLEVFSKMPTKPFAVSIENPYHITGRCLNREWFALPLDTVWDILSDYLYFVSHSYNLRIHSFVLMLNHFHLLLSSPTGELSRGMQYFLSQTSRQLAKESGRINHIWGSRFYRCEITSHHYFLNAYKYNYRNPVASGTVTRVEDYRFSTLHGLLGQSKLIIPVVEDFTLFSDVEGTLQWLNTPVSMDHQTAVRKALTHKKFQLPRANSRVHPLEFDLL